MHFKMNVLYHFSKQCNSLEKVPLNGLCGSNSVKIGPLFTMSCQFNEYTFT